MCDAASAILVRRRQTPAVVRQQVSGCRFAGSTTSVAVHSGDRDRQLPLSCGNTWAAGRSRDRTAMASATVASSRREPLGEKGAAAPPALRTTAAECPAAAGALRRSHYILREKGLPCN